MSVEKKYFGTLADGSDVSLYILKAGRFQAAFSDYGATWVSFLMPDRNGVIEDVILGFSTLSPYAAKHPFFGSTVGRFANRIADARFKLDGKEYQLFANNGTNHLHGGRRGFDKVLWSASIFESENAVRFSRKSPDGEEGYPGNLTCQVFVSLSNDGRLKLRYTATADARTPVNLTNHAYFNLEGEGKGTILNHILTLNASRYLPVDSRQIPLPGAPLTVEGSVFDFRKPKRVGADMGSELSGYDHCYVIDRDETTSIMECAAISAPISGRRLKVSTTLPGVQFYTGNNISSLTGKQGSLYDKYSGFCLETQYFPDSPNRDDFPSCILSPGQTWEHETEYCFSIS